MEFLWNNKIKLAAAAAGAYYAACEAGMFNKSVKNDVAVVTGAGGGIGRLMAIRLAKEGCKLALLDINTDAVEKVREEIAQMGVTVKSYKCDVSKHEEIYSVFKTIEDDFGRIDILINNAGIVNGKKLPDLSPDRIDLTLKINTNALVHTTKAVLAQMIERDHGHIVNIASSAGLVGVAGMVDYCASKSGAIGCSDATRIELANMGSKVKCTCVCPMYIKTGMFDSAELVPNRAFLRPLVKAMFPLLEPQYVADEVINAMLRNQQLLVTPVSANLAPILKSLLPVSVCDTVLDELGVTSSMKNFKQTRPLQKE